MKKEDYIKKEIERYEERKVGFYSFIKNLDNQIEKVKNLTDEEYEKILEKERKEKEEDEEVEDVMNTMLEKYGLTLEDLDKISLDDLKDGMDLDEIKNKIK